MAQCPCGKKNNYLSCCGPYINGTATPANPEQLMRSRYTAYTKADIAYIKKTMSGIPLLGFDEDEAKNWAKRVKWLSLQVLEAECPVDENQGYVEFIACYAENNTIKTIHERSRFNRKNEQWFYTQGTPGAK